MKIAAWELNPSVCKINATPVEEECKDNACYDAISYIFVHQHILRLITRKLVSIAYHKT